MIGIHPPIDFYDRFNIHAGDKATAIALYSKAVVELKNGIACSLNVEGKHDYGMIKILRT